jgi:hypothetical protein
MVKREHKFEWSRDIVKRELVLRSFHTWIVRGVEIDEAADGTDEDPDSGVFVLHGRVGKHKLTLDLVLLEGLEQAQGVWELSASEPSFLGEPPRACA